MKRTSMTKGGKRGVLLALLGVLAMAVGCGGKMPDNLGAQDGALLPCPESPNCVSSFATDELHSIPGLQITGSPEAAWQALRSDLDGRDNVEIIRDESGYLQTVFTTSLMRYRDDVEFLFVEAGVEIAVRSASRVGYGDMGANRDRIESIRSALAAKGLVKGAAATAD